VPDAGIEVICAGGRVPRMAGGIMPGKARRVDGGYRIDGRWSWGSGIRHAEWVGVLVLAEGGADARPEPRIAVVPAASLELFDNWHVAGLKGTGSCDYAAHDLFVADAFTFSMAPWAPVRGGPLYQQGLPGFLINELAGFALGVGRRALDAIIELAESKKRGYSKRTSLADRQVFQRAIGEGDLRLRAARHLAFDVFERAWETVCAGQIPDLALQLEMSGAATLAVDTALAVSLDAFRYGGGTAVYLHHTLQRCLRDLQVSAAHQLVNDVAYEKHGRYLLGARDIDPMGG
jgi:alkylation response protein AidB-like acyl-CoA dehydrogenase